MPNSSWVGDYHYMFPHMKEKIILADGSLPLKKVRDNVALIHAIDLSPLLEKLAIEKRKVKQVRLQNEFAIRTKRINSNF